MTKNNKFILKGFIIGIAVSMIVSMHLYLHANKKISSIKDNNCWNKEGY